MRHSNAKKVVILRHDATGREITAESQAAAAVYLGLRDTSAMVLMLARGANARNGYTILRIGEKTYDFRKEVGIRERKEAKIRPGEHPSWRTSPPINYNPPMREGVGYEPHIRVSVGMTAGKRTE